MNNSRTTILLKNTITGIASQAIILVLNFVTRTVFINYLNAEYLGVNGLFANILRVLSLAELGLGSAITYSLYKPLAEKDETAISSLMNFYASAYKVIGLVVGLLGISIYPFLDNIIHDTLSIGNINYIYLLFLLNSVFSYFFAYKRTLITADQKNYIISYYHIIFSILKSLLQIGVLIVTKNYLLFLIIQIATTLLENIFVSLKSDKLYPFIKENRHTKLPKKEKTQIINNVKALMIYKVGGTALDGTDNIIISAFVGVVAVGKLSNYMLITSSLSMVVQHFINSVTSSIGNFIAKEDREKHEDLLKIITFIFYLIFGFSFVCLVMLFNPFIEIWIGTDYLLNQATAFVIAFNFYITGMMGAVWSFRSTMGLFVHGKYRPLISAFINIVVSIILVGKYGLVGVLLGTTITRVVTNVWFDPFIIYKHGLHKPVGRYYIVLLKYFVVSMLTIVLLSIIFSFLPELSLVTFIIQGFMCIVTVYLMNFVFFHKTKEYMYVKNKLMEILETKLIKKSV